MWMPNSQTIWVKDFKGYSDARIPSDNPIVTSDITNVKVERGRLIGRGGSAKYQSISAASSADIIGLFNFRRVSGTHQICRLLPAAFEVESGGSWTDKTGTALTATAAARPMATVIDDVLVFTNGVDLPRKFDGTNNSSSIAAGTSPYSKGTISYLGYLFLFDVSLDGTFTDVVDGHRSAYFSDDWDNNWDPCEGNTIDLDETPGSWLGAVVLGRTLFAIKSDGVVRLQWTRGNEFNQELIEGAVGTVSGLTVLKVSEQFAFYLGTDGIIYRLDVSGRIIPVTWEHAHKLLANTSSLNKLSKARALHDPYARVYYLLYDRTGLSGQLLDSYLSVNFLTGELSKGEIGLSVIACTDFKASDQAAQQLLVSTATLVENFDTSASGTDDGTAVTRRWTSDWQSLNEEGWLMGVRLQAAKSARCRVAIDLALDGSASYEYKEVLTLRGGAPSDEFVEVMMKIPPQYTKWAKVRLRFFHDSTNVVEVLRVGFVVAPKQRVASKEERAAEAPVAS